MGGPVEHGGARTDHRVTVHPGFAAAVGCRAVGDAEFVRVSFAFLLDREPARSILDRFAVDVIPRYFPEYASAIRGYLDGPPIARAATPPRNPGPPATATPQSARSLDPSDATDYSTMT